MTAPTLRRLLAAFPDLTREQAILIRKIAHGVRWAVRPDGTSALRDVIDAAPECAATRSYVASMHSDPYTSLMWRTTVALHAIDKILGTYGVEPLGPGDYREGPPFEYCNAGDPYVATLIYARDGERLFIGSWGDVVERHDPNGEW